MGKLERAHAAMQLGKALKAIDKMGEVMASLDTCKLCTACKAMKKAKRDGK